MILTNLLLLEECFLIFRPLYMECESVVFYNLCSNKQTELLVSRLKGDTNVH